MKYIEKFIVIGVVMVLRIGAAPLAAQEYNKVALSTNVADYVQGGGMNIDASVGVSQHWSLVASARYNPYSQDSRQRSFSVGTRYWPWYLYAGWWISADATYQEYSQTGDFLREGDKFGASLWLGFSRLLSKHFNLDAGWGLWGGYESYKVYGCETCSRIREEGDNYFLAPNRIILSISYIF